MAGSGQDPPAHVRDDLAGDGGDRRVDDDLSAVPTPTPDPTGGQVIVTRFECPNLRVLVYLLALHVRIKRDVRRHAPGLIASRVVVHWRQRTMLSISLWPDLDSVYDMGSVPRHVIGSRIPGKLGVATSSGVFTFVGDWRRVMFGSPATPRSPLRPLGSRCDP